MKKYYRRILLTFILFISVLLITPNKIDAKILNTNYSSVNAISEHALSNVSIREIEFKHDAKKFGVVGVVHNSDDVDVKLSSIVGYYDSKYNLILQKNMSLTVKPEVDTVYKQNINIDELPTKYKLEDIAYYKITWEANRIIPEKIVQENEKTSVRDYTSYDYVIDNYDVNIKVNEDNTFDITETISVFFNKSKHGIIRNIPLSYTITRLDGTSEDVISRVSNINVNTKFSKDQVKNDAVIKIGSSDKTVIGVQNYIIDYKYKVKKDNSKEYDEFYFDIIGDKWDTVIGKVTFTITMPKEFDVSKVGFSSGKVGSTENDNISYNIEGNVITGSYNSILQPREAITIRTELSEGYFKNRLSITEPAEFIELLVDHIDIIMLLPAIFTFVVFLGAIVAILFFSKKKSKKGIQ